VRIAFGGLGAVLPGWGFGMLAFGLDMLALLGRFGGFSGRRAASHQHHRGSATAAQNQNGGQNDEEHQGLAGHLLLGGRTFAAFARRRVGLGRFGFLRLFLLGQGSVPGESVPPGAPGYPAKSSPEG
jgi:hypothetical protein